MKYGSDFIVKILKKLDIEYIAYNPGATVKGLLESLARSNIKLILCCHEQIAISIAHGYAKTTGKIMAVLIHSNVGLLNAALGIFNAWCDRVPILIINGCGPLDAEKRRPWIDWIHTSNSQGIVVSEYVKWYDQPMSLYAVKESLCRAYAYAMTCPQAPVLLCIDCELQEMEVQVSKETMEDIQKDDLLMQLPTINNIMLEEIHNKIMAAQNPVFIAGRISINEKSRKLLESLLEKFSILIVDMSERYFMQSSNKFYWKGEIDEVLSKADLIVALEVGRIDNIAEKYDRCKIYSIGMNDLLISKWSADYQSFSVNVKRIISDVGMFIEDWYKHSIKSKQKYKSIDISRISYANDYFLHNMVQNQVLYKLGKILETEKYLLTNFGSYGNEEVIRTSWNLTEESYHLGDSGGAGLGYGLGASIGAAFGISDDQFCVNIQSDGDFLFLPSGLWTLIHYRLPLIIILMNNLGYGNTRRHAFNISEERGYVCLDSGSDLTNPKLDYSAIAKGFGFQNVEKVTDIEQIESVMKKVIKEVKKQKQPYFVEIQIEGEV